MADLLADDRTILSSPGLETPGLDRGLAGPRSLAEQARALTGFFSERAAANEALGRLTDETLQALREGGFLRMWIPRCFGGLELPPVAALEVIPTARPAGC